MMIRLVKYIERRKRLLVLLLLAATFMSFSLPKETFDPHLGVDYDIFCQLSSYLHIDPGSFGWIVDVTPVVPEAFYTDFNESFIAQLLVSHKPIRAPPGISSFPNAA